MSESLTASPSAPMADTKCEALSNKPESTNKSDFSIGCYAPAKVNAAQYNGCEKGLAEGCALENRRQACESCS